VLPGPATGRPLDSPRLADVDKPGYSEPPLAGDETATLLGSLERVRATVAWKCGGLDAAGHADLIRESVDGLTGEDPPR
jgi:hypothetical protein